MSPAAALRNNASTQTGVDSDFDEIDYRPNLNRDRTVQIYDEDLRTRESLMTLFRLEGFKTSQFSNRTEFFGSPGPLPDVLVANFTDWDNEAQAMLTQVRLSGPETVVVALLDNSLVELAVDLMRAGACDVLARPINMERLISSVREALRQDVQIGVSAGGQPTVVVQGFKTLTQREREVLQLVVAGHSNKAAATALGISPRTIEVHRSRLMRKLGANNTADLLRIVLTS